MFSKKLEIIHIHKNGWDTPFGNDRGLIKMWAKMSHLSSFIGVSQGLDELTDSGCCYLYITAPVARQSSAFVMS